MARDLSVQEILDFQTHGAVLVKNAVSNQWIEQLHSVVEQQLAAPSKWGNDQQGPKAGRMFTDRYLWQENKIINDFIHQSECAKLAGQAMKSRTSRFYFDHLLIKEPNTKTPTPWHQDIPYWPFLGKQVTSIWLALTETTIEGSSLEFVSGSHLKNTYYQAQSFNKNNTEKDSWMGKSQSEPVPDIEANRKAYSIIGWDVEPGDAIIFSAWVLHGARGNASSSNRRAALSTRWLGDDAIWQPHAGADPTVKQEDVSVQPGESPHDDNVFPLIWEQT